MYTSTLKLYTHACYVIRDVIYLEARIEQMRKQMEPSLF